jgi:hypothetical protein
VLVGERVLARGIEDEHRRLADDSRDIAMMHRVHSLTGAADGNAAEVQRVAGLDDPINVAAFLLRSSLRRRNVLLLPSDGMDLALMTCRSDARNGLHTGSLGFTDRQLWLVHGRSSTRWRSFREILECRWV